jgi:hypothetical protein
MRSLNAITSTPRPRGGRRGCITYSIYIVNQNRGSAACFTIASVKLTVVRCSNTRRPRSVLKFEAALLGGLSKWLGCIPKGTTDEEIERIKS